MLAFLAFVAPAAVSHISIASAQTQGTANVQAQGEALNQGQGAAKEGSKPAMATLPNPLKVKSLSELLYKTVDFVLSLAYIVIAFFLLLSGFKFVTAQGSEDKLKEAKTMFFNTIVGAVIIIGAQTIIAVLKSLFESLQK